MKRQLFAQNFGRPLVGIRYSLLVGHCFVFDPIQLSVLVVNLAAHIQSHVFQIGHDAGHLTYILFHHVFSLFFGDSEMKKCFLKYLLHRFYVKNDMFEFQQLHRKKLDKNFYKYTGPNFFL